ncbi:MAG: hypothetical protein WC476_08625 [Phycisphaerae bacterium]|jgi:type II secretory pathway pseudopilin PulG
MAVKRPKFGSAVTLIEVLISIVILGIAAIGALNYQYYAAGHARIARAQRLATRTAQLVLEDWKSTGGSADYDLSTLGLGFSMPIQIPDQWDEEHGAGLGTTLNDSVYTITVDSLPMILMLIWQDVDVDTSAQITLRQLSVIVGFGAIDENGDVIFEDSHMENIPEVTLSTYTRVEGS